MEEEIKSQVELIKDLSDEISSAESQSASEHAAESKPAGQKSAKAPKERKPFTQWPVFGWFLNSKNVGALIGKCLLLLAIPYAYLIILCLIFDTLLKLYSAAGFILYSTLIFWAINIALIVWAIVRFTKVRRA